MTSLADRTIAALRTVHDDLAGLVPTLSEDQLTSRSGAAEWTVAQVLSHLGSGAEISQASFRAALEDTSAPDQDFNQGVWDRWNALSPEAQASEFVDQDAALIGLLESLTPTERESFQVKLGFLPAPIPLAAAAGMRLNEAALHAWDVHVALAPTATLGTVTAEVLLEQFAEGLAFLLGFLGKADQLSEPARVRIDGSELAIVIEDQVSVTPSTGEPTATFSGGPDAAARLLGGRLTKEHTPAGVGATGNVSLDDLRRVFSGF